jgi:hypothetical protein
MQYTKFTKKYLADKILSLSKEYSQRYTTDEMLKSHSKCELIEVIDDFDKRLATVQEFLDKVAGGDDVMIGDDSLMTSDNYSSRCDEFKVAWDEEKSDFDDQDEYDQRIEDRMKFECGAWDDSIKHTGDGNKFFLECIYEGSCVFIGVDTAEQLAEALDIYTIQEPNFN